MNTAVVGDPENPICQRADREFHDIPDETFKIRACIICDTVSIDFSRSDNEGTLVVASAVPFVPVFTPEGRARSRRCLMPGPGANTGLFVGTNDNILIGWFFAFLDSVVQI
jgi:hypothetical protein